MFLFMLLVTYFDIYRPVYCHFNKDTKLSQGQGRPLRRGLDCLLQNNPIFYASANLFFGNRFDLARFHSKYHKDIAEHQ